MMKAATPFIVLLLCLGISAKSCVDQLKELASSPPLLGAFKPVCQPNGLFADTQCKNTYCYCVVPETGEEILGTTIRFTKPKSCQATPCLLQRHQGLLKTRQGMVGHFQPKCAEDGSFEKVQCHGSTGYCYCVAPATGEKVLGTEIRGTPTNCDVQVKKCLDELEALKTKKPLLGAFKPECQTNGLYAETQCFEGSCYCVVPETGEKLLGTSQKLPKKPISCKVTPCLLQQHQGLLKTSNHMVGHFQPKCAEDGSFEKIQCHGSTGFCFCVATDTGARISGTEVRGTPENCEVAGTKSGKCLTHLQTVLAKKPMLGAFKPVCQDNGLYKETQCHAGYCFCVIPETGEKILGTSVRFTNPKTCKATACFMGRHNAMKDTQKGMVGQFTPECEDDGSFKATQCHASTGYCYCVIQETGEKLLGTEVRFTEPKSCELTECMRQRHEALNSNLLGKFKPDCDEVGAYTPMQCHEGFCYCVITETGEELMGTRLERGQKPTSCKVTKCVKERHNVLSAKIPLLGAFRPECSEDGQYKPIQCHEMTCHCVFTETGEEVLGTMTRFSKPKSCKLTPCILARHKAWKLTKFGILGASISRCDANGQYQKVQCRKGMCWCVDPNSGKQVEGTSTSWTVPRC